MAHVGFLHSREMGEGLVVFPLGATELLDMFLLRSFKLCF
jgi:hypothetical protein